jgi:hypothetical protein
MGRFVIRFNQQRRTDALLHVTILNMCRLMKSKFDCKRMHEAAVRKFTLVCFVSPNRSFRLPAEELNAFVMAKYLNILFTRTIGMN